MNKELKFKNLLKPLRLAMYDFTENSVRKELNNLVKDNALVHLGYPINDTIGPDDFYKKSFKKLHFSFPDLDPLYPLTIWELL